MTNGNTPCISGGCTNMMAEDGSDLIRRSDALDCFHAWVDKYGDVHTPDEMAEYRAIEELPSVEPKHTKKRTETHACDLISRQAVTDTVRKIILGFFSDEDGVMTDTEKTLLSVNKAICNGVRELPSAQPEIVRCKDCLMHGVCRFEQGLGVDGYCSQAERRTDGSD